MIHLLACQLQHRRRRLSTFFFGDHNISSNDELVIRLRAFRAIAAGPHKAFNKHDGSAVGALYVANAVHVTPVGTFSGREAIEGHMTNLFQPHNPSDRITKVSYVYFPRDSRDHAEKLSAVRDQRKSGKSSLQ